MRDRPARPGGLAGAAGRRAGGAAGGRSVGPGGPRDVRRLGGLVHPAEHDVGCRGPAVRHDTDGLQVDRAGARAGVRLRGGDRVLLRPGGGGRQGRHHHSGAGARPRRTARRRGTYAARPARRGDADPRAARHRPVGGPHLRRRRDRRGDGPAADRAARRPGRRGGDGH
ncbi:hypothetical protein SDC9_176711 [bioreactor metagenome]|uniref:Uncharacterized protein n=1 Tax=bioreactor metagenome TaxID=1076179 RepID=A0A645GSJ9_9ZZZZ